jgi:class 3 adenylate cyclase
MLRRGPERARLALAVCALCFGIGFALHLGEVALGLLGPPGGRPVTLVGDTANVAARLCSRARNGEVLFSSTVAAARSPLLFKCSLPHGRPVEILLTWSAKDWISQD